MSNKKICLISGIIFCAIFLFTCGGGGSKSNSSGSSQNISVSKSSIDFGDTLIGSNAYQSLTITNTGSKDLIIGQISISGSGFTISDGNTGPNITLKPSVPNTIIVRFSPLIENPPDGSISIQSNDPDSSLVTVPLKGKGYGFNVFLNNVNTENCPSSIKVDVAVTNSVGKVENLNAQNFNVKLDGQDVSITSVTEGTTQEHVSVVIALDFSSSLQNILGPIRDAAKEFIDHLNVDDEVALCFIKSDNVFFPNSSSTPSTPPYLIKATDTPIVGGKAKLRDQIDIADTTGIGTALYDAIYNSVDIAASGTNTIKAVIVISDGVNSVVGGPTKDAAKDYASDNNIPIFSIFYVDENIYPSMEPETLRQFANATGGICYESETIQNIFNQISSVFNNIYTIDYSIPGTICPQGSFNLEVTIESNNFHGTSSIIANY